MRRTYEAKCSKCGFSLSTDNQGVMECGHGKWFTDNGPVVTMGGYGPVKPIYVIPRWSPPPYEYDPRTWGAL